MEEATQQPQNRFLRVYETKTVRIGGFSNSISRQDKGIRNRSSGSSQCKKRPIWHSRPPRRYHWTRKREEKGEKEGERKTNETASRCFTKGFQMGMKDGWLVRRRKRRREKRGKLREGREEEKKNENENENENVNEWWKKSGGMTRVCLWIRFYASTEKFRGALGTVIIVARPKGRKSCARRVVIDFSEMTARLRR